VAKNDARRNLMIDENSKIVLIGNQQEASRTSVIRESLEKETEKETLLNVHQLKEGQRVSIGKVLFKIQRVRQDLTIVIKPIGKVD